jgi:hypothetical protein
MCHGGYLSRRGHLGLADAVLEKLAELQSECVWCGCSEPSPLFAIHRGCWDNQKERLAELEAEAGMERMGFTKAESRNESYAKLSDKIDKWQAEDEAELAGKCAQAELAAYVAACKAMCPTCSRLPEGQVCENKDRIKGSGLQFCRAHSVRALIADWHKRNDCLKPKCDHCEIYFQNFDDGNSTATCVRCKATRKKGWLCEWEKPVDEPRKAATV